MGEKSMKERVDEIKQERANESRVFEDRGIDVGDLKIMVKLHDAFDLSTLKLPERVLKNLTWDTFIKLANRRIIQGSKITDNTPATELLDAFSFLVKGLKGSQKLNKTTDS